MKKNALILLLLLPLGLRAQVADSARLVVDHYLSLLRLEKLPADSMLFIESRIFSSGQGDTLVMKRWHVAPNMDRMEMWAGGALRMAFVGDGRKVRHKYDPARRDWRLLTEESYIDLQMPYDFRGPLYNHHLLGLDLLYEGTVAFRDTPCHRVKAQREGYYDRLYLFEQKTGLLFFVDELDSGLGKFKNPEAHVDWRAVMEFTPVGEAMLPSKECYQQNSQITIIHHTYSLLPIDKSLFKNPTK